MTEPRTIDPDAVDRVLGAGIHQAWRQVQEQFVTEQSRANENRSRYSEAWASSLQQQLEDDLAFAEKAVDDYLAFLARASAGEPAEGSEGEKILGVLVLAVSVLGSVNDLLDDVFVFRIHSLLTALAGAKLEVEARSLQDRLRRLREELDTVGRECRGASVRPAIDAATAAALACSQPLRLLAGGARGLAQMIADNYLGRLPADPTSSNPGTWGGQGDTRFDAVLSAWQKYIAESGKVATFAGSAGMPVKVTGFLFDIDEIAPSFSGRRKLKEFVEETREYHQWYVRRLQSYLVLLAGLPPKFAVLGRDVQKRPNGWTAPIRQRLELEMRDAGYRPRP